MRYGIGVVVAIVLGTAACTGGSPGPSTGSTTTASPTPTATATTTATATVTRTATLPAGFATTAASSPGFPAATAHVIGSAVRVGGHGTYDRVVYEFAGTGAPAFRVRYVARPIGDPSGSPVLVRGAAYLEVVVSGLGYPEPGDPEPQQLSTAALAGTVVAESGVLYGGFEGTGQTFIGVRDRVRAFRAYALAGPPRLVVDIATG